MTREEAMHRLRMMFWSSDAQSGTAWYMDTVRHFRTRPYVGIADMAELDYSPRLGVAMVRQANYPLARQMTAEECDQLDLRLIAMHEGASNAFKAD
jgi:hypothetical protein